MERIFLVGNPITHCYHYRIMAIAACGKSLRMIDNEPVRKPELDRAISLGKVSCHRLLLEPGARASLTGSFVRELLRLSGTDGFLTTCRTLIRM